MLVRHRMGVWRINVTIDFDNTIFEAELLRDERPHPDPVLRFPFDLDVLALDRFAPGLAPRYVSL